MDFMASNEAILEVKRWRKNTIAAGRRHSVALKVDGTVVATGDNRYGQCQVGGWRDIVAVRAGNVHMARNTGNTHTLGLRANGTVVAVGLRSGQVTGILSVFVRMER